MYHTQIPKLSPLAAMPAPPVILLPLLPAASGTRAPAEANPCASLTPEALQRVIDKVAESLAKAESDVNADDTTGKYLYAAVYNRNFLAEVHQNLLSLQSGLKNQGLDTPFVTDTTAAYTIHGAVREAVYPLHHARLWASISVVYRKSSDAFDSYSLTSEAIDLAEALGAQAGRCFMRPYFPPKERK